MFYSISGLCPSREDGNYDFQIKLYPAFKKAVSKRNMTQEDIERIIGTLGRKWLDSCGYDTLWDPERLIEIDEPLGPNARYLYESHSIRVKWGEWGPEHINIPGNACGLDIDKGHWSPRGGGRTLLPHNIDGWSQVQLLLIVFTWFADHLALYMEDIQ